MNAELLFQAKSCALYLLPTELLQEKVVMDDFELIISKFNLKYFIIAAQRRIQLLLFDGNKSEKSYFYIVRASGKNIGIVFLSPINLYRTNFLVGNCFEITIEIQQKYRNKNYGFHTLSKLIPLHPNIYAIVREQNSISKRLFSGFCVEVGQLSKNFGFIGSQYFIKSK